MRASERRRLKVRPANIVVRTPRHKFSPVTERDNRSTSCPELGRCWRCGPIWGQCRLNSGDVRPISVDFGPCWACSSDFGSNSTNSGRCRPIWARIRPLASDAGRIWGGFDRARAKSTNLDGCSAICCHICLESVLATSRTDVITGHPLFRRLPANILDGQQLCRRRPEALRRQSGKSPAHFRQDMRAV